MIQRKHLESRLRSLAALVHFEQVYFLYLLRPPSNTNFLQSGLVAMTWSKERKKILGTTLDWIRGQISQDPDTLNSQMWGIMWGQVWESM